MFRIDFLKIVKDAWKAYDASRTILFVEDISAKVSTNHVYKISFVDGLFVIAKLSYFGRYEHFVEDHTAINSLSINLPYPYEHLLSRSLVKGNQLFVYRHKDSLIDAWVVFYRPVKIEERLPRRLNEEQIAKLGTEFANFHKACHLVRNTLPGSSKTLKTDIDHLLEIVNSDFGEYEHRSKQDIIFKQSELLIENLAKQGYATLDKIPVFVDWNIGNFSMTKDWKLFSRWDYDWFRFSSRILDFYFLSRVVSDVGDRTVFTYNVGTLMEDRFILFLKNYHAVFPLKKEEIILLKEAYRFFILNYVIKDGRYFFHEIYATKLQKEAYETYFPSIDAEFDADKLIKALGL
jgi:Ser/Thr protein kinase RdoA (MazF antagonist)